MFFLVKDVGRDAVQYRGNCPDFGRPMFPGPAPGSHGKRGIRYAAAAFDDRQRQCHRSCPSHHSCDRLAIHVSLFDAQYTREPKPWQFYEVSN